MIYDKSSSWKGNLGGEPRRKRRSTTVFDLGEIIPDIFKDPELSKYPDQGYLDKNTLFICFDSECVTHVLYKKG